MPHVGRHCAGEYGLCSVRLCGTPGGCVPTLDDGVRRLAGALVTVIKKTSISVQHTLSHIRSSHFARCHRCLTSCRLNSDVARRLVNGAVPVADSSPDKRAHPTRQMSALD